MSEDTTLTPLPTDVSSLFDEERARPGLPAGARERLRARIDLLAPLGGLAGGEGGGGGSDGGSGGAGAGGSVGAAAASGGALKGAIASKIAIAAVAFGVGGASGAAVHATLAPTAAPAPAIAASASASAAPPPVASFAPPPSASSSSALSVEDLPNAAPRASAKVTPSASDPSKDGLKQERASLEVARTAITRGDYAGAIAALDRHAAAFPRGQLAEERELMRIQALVGQGRGPEAKARAAQFHRDFPHSLMKGAVDATVRSIP